MSRENYIQELKLIRNKISIVENLQKFYVMYEGKIIYEWHSLDLAKRCAQILLNEQLNKLNRQRMLEINKEGNITNTSFNEF